jgi:hypothetical protein
MVEDIVEITLVFGVAGELEHFVDNSIGKFVRHSRQWTCC